MPDPKTFHFDLDPAQRPSNATLKEEWYPNIQAAAVAASSSRIFDPITGVRAIVIHATAGGSSSGAASVTFAGKASFHWLVPDEDETQHGKFVWATCHEARAAWHVRNSASHPRVWNGNTKINHYSMGIEVVNRQLNSDSFSDWQVEATAEIVRYCWAKYPNLRHVVSHAMLDPTRRSDPGTLFPWDKFKQLVLGSPTTPVPDEATVAALPEVVECNCPCCMD